MARSLNSRNQPDIDVAKAAEVFVRGFSFTRSFTHPYEAKRVGNLWTMRDAPRVKRDVLNYRTQECVAFATDPVEADRVARKGSEGRFSICAIRRNDEPDEPLRDSYKLRGYRLLRTEPLMIHRLRRIPSVQCAFPIERVTTQELADRLAKAARSRQILPEHLSMKNPPLRQYVVLDDARPIGWARSIVLDDATWLSNVYVDPAYRRRGIGRAMIARVLRDDRANGARVSVLLASHTGSHLYSAVGYEQIGELLLFVARKR